MEIAPIAGIRMITAIKARPVDPEVTAFFEIEPTSRPDDDTYTGSGRKAAGAEESEEENQEIEADAVDEEINSAPVAPGRLSIFV